MKKAKTSSGDGLREEYKRTNFGKMVRGKYAARFAQETNVVLLDPVVAKALPTDKAVNDALRSLIEIATVTTRLTSKSRRVVRKPS